MKIVMLCDFYNETMEYQENLLVKYYAKHGHSVTVITSTFESVFDYYSDQHDNSVPARTYYDQGAKIIKLRYRYNILNRLRAYTTIYHILEDEEPDLIYVHDIMLNILEAVRYKKRHPPCRMIMDYHADYSNSGKNWVSLRILHGVIRKWFLDRARPHLSKIFPIVPAGAVFLHEIYGVPHSEMELLPLGADLDRCQLVRERQVGPAMRKDHGISVSDIVIFTGGKLAPTKKTELIIEAVLSLDRPDIHLFIVGDASEADASYKQELMQQAASTTKIHFTGWLESSETYRYLAMADLAVFPASQSILWQQAIGMGLPLIVGDTGHQDISYLNGCGNIIMFGGDAITSERIADAIGRLTSDPVYMKQMAEGALQVANEKLNWDKLILETLRFN